ncbi:MAG: DUF5688 family protein [Lachnospiraceae bacterium]|nr:DUF5688 family protein [Lachnospiraceae bacterium]
MDYKMFKECILDGMKERFADNEFEYKEVLKNNGVKLDGLVVKTSGNRLFPTVYVNDYYSMFEKSNDMCSICDMIENVIRDNTVEGNIDVDSLIDFESVKDRIVFKLINFEKNAELLENVPYKKFLDLAIVYYILIGEEAFNNGSILINNSHIKMWGKSVEDIDAIAKENAPELLKADIKSIEETLKALLPGEENIEEDLLSGGCNMYVLSNDKNMFGASVLLYDNVMSQFKDIVKGDMFILPSSVHEVIMIPSMLVDEISRLDEMICEVNETQVPVTDILSDHAYIYNFEKRCITCAS